MNTNKLAIKSLLTPVYASLLVTALSTPAFADFSMLSETKDSTLTVNTTNDLTGINTLSRQPLLIDQKESFTIEGLELLNEIGKYPEKIPFIKVTPPNEEDIKQRLELGHRLGHELGLVFSEEPIKLSSSRLALRDRNDPSSSFEIDLRTGNFLFNAGLSQYRDEATTQGLPNESELFELAQRVIKSNGLPVDFTNTSIEHIGGINLGVHQDDGGTMIYEKFKTLRLSREINGWPVQGDSRLVFQFGEKSELNTFVFQWPLHGKLNYISAADLERPQQLIEDATAIVDEMSANALSAKITTVDLVLYDDGQGLMEPAYHIVLERNLKLDEEITMIPYDFYLPIRTNPVAFFPQFESSPSPTVERNDTESSALLLKASNE